MTAAEPSCPFCSSDGGVLIWRDHRVRIVLADEPDWPGFCRVIWHAHAAELTDLDPLDREHLMRRVFATETALRDLLHPDKINLASLGNLVPHVHWHVIPRWSDDSRFPSPIWAPATRAAAARTLPKDFAAALRGALARASASA